MSAEPSGDLVTGASGFIGRALVKHLERSDGDRVWSLSRKPAKESSNEISIDLLERDLELPAVRRVFHLAGAAHSRPRTSEDRRRFYEINVDGLRNLLDGLDSRPPVEFVLASTVAVYGAEEGIEIAESRPLAADDPYGDSKRIAEEVVAEWAERRSVVLTIARLPLVAGPEAPGNFGAMIRALRNGKYLGVGDGSARRSMILVDDLARALPLMSGTPGVFHVNDGLHPSFRELERALVSALDRSAPLRLPLAVARVAAQVGSTAESVLRRSMPFNRNVLTKMTATLTFSNQKFRETFDWRPGDVCEAVAQWKL